MISKAFQTFKTSKAVIIGAVCLLALVLLTAGIAWRVAGANEALWISYTYADPKGVTLYNAIYSTSNPIFAEQSMRFNKNSNGSATLVGDDFSKSFSKAVIADNWDIEDGTQLDAETFYFDNPGDGQGVRWAYTFTGWHIVAAGDVYILMETVFQPGDVIPKHVLDTYAPTTDKNNPLVFEPLWGRCYFVQNAKDASDNPTGTQSAATYINPGNDPATPLPTIQDVYLVRSNHEKIFPNGEMTNKVTSDVMELVENYSDLNAYSHAIMLTGDLTVDDSSGSFAMFSNYVWPHSTTIKSLQATRANDGTLTMSEGTKHTFTFSVTASKHGRAEYTIFGSTRFDNVNYKQTTNPIFEIKDEWGDSVSYLAETVRKNDH